MHHRCIIIAIIVLGLLVSGLAMQPARAQDDGPAQRASGCRRFVSNGAVHIGRRCGDATPIVVLPSGLQVAAPRTMILPRSLPAPFLSSRAATRFGLLGAGSDITCEDFDDEGISRKKAQKRAQRFFERNGGPRNDPFGLDEDGDGRACEELL